MAVSCKHLLFSMEEGYVGDYFVIIISLHVPVLLFAHYYVIGISSIIKADVLAICRTKQ